ncbi:hypothetical protein ACGFX2_32750 [Streptomyces goshikiensis]|uniref:hypothetical protein n=1 Tax=Streptomyces goshikiensis TaxID=1942 RepID=UPI003716037F
MIPVYLFIAHPGVDATTGSTIAALVVVLPLVLLVLRLAFRSNAEAVANTRESEEILPFRMQIWREASVCLRCYVAFWPARNGHRRVVPVDEFQQAVSDLAIELRRKSQEPHSG